MQILSILTISYLFMWASRALVCHQNTTRYLNALIDAPPPSPYHLLELSVFFSHCLMYFLTCMVKKTTSSEEVKFTATDLIKQIVLVQPQIHKLMRQKEITLRPRLIYLFCSKWLSGIHNHLACVTNLLALLASDAAAFTAQPVTFYLSKLQLIINVCQHIQNTFFHGLALACFLPSFLLTTNHSLLPPLSSFLNLAHHHPSRHRLEAEQLKRVLLNRYLCVVSSFVSLKYNRALAITEPVLSKYFEPNAIASMLQTPSSNIQTPHFVNKE